MRINESTIRRIIREEARRALHEGLDSKELMHKFIQAQRDISLQFVNIYGQAPDPIDNVRQDVYAVVSKINDEFERVGFVIEDYMEALKSAMQESGVTIEYNIDDYADSPLTDIEVVESDDEESDDEER